MSDILGRDRIMAYKNGQPYGFIKSVSNSKGSVNFTQSRESAKTYALGSGQEEVDLLTSLGSSNGFSFALE